MKRTAILCSIALGIALTACARVNVPPADYSDTEAETTAAGAGDETAASGDTAASTDTASTAVTSLSTAVTRMTTTTAATTTTSEDEEDADEDEDEEAETETETKPVSAVDAQWSKAYAKLLEQKNRRSDHLDAYYALIRLDPDLIPELVVLDDTSMELYHIADGKTELLMEDAYKSSAVSEQNVCYQPIVGKFASYFSTMGGGTGYNIYVYEKLDALHVQRILFDNNEDEGGEMPYNPIWDKAKEYDVQNNGYNDVSLGETWVHIGKRFKDCYKLAAADDAQLRSQWELALDESRTEGEYVEDEEETDENEYEDGE